MAVVTIRSLLEAGVHFGHQKEKWNPKMAKYIYTVRNKIHIINLEISAQCIEEAYSYVCELAKENKKILFVGTKKQAQDAIREAAELCGMYYIDKRWLGGTLTNFITIRNSIEKLNKINQQEKLGEFELLPKKEVAQLKHERDRLETNLGGIKNMRELPDALVVVDINNEAIAVNEARKLGIPVVALVDTNCNPDDIDYVIPGNDDAIRSIKLITNILAHAVIEGRDGIAYEVTEDDALDENELDSGEIIDKDSENEELEIQIKPKKATKKKEEIAEKVESKKADSEPVVEKKDEKAAVKKETVKAKEKVEVEKKESKPATEKAEKRETKTAAKKTKATTTKKVEKTETTTKKETKAKAKTATKETKTTAKKAAEKTTKTTAKTKAKKEEKADKEKEPKKTKTTATKKTTKKEE